MTRCARCRLAFKWNQENLIEKCCNLMAALVYVVEENIAYDQGAMVNNPRCNVIGRVGYAVLLLLLAEFAADLSLARFAKVYCNVDMTSGLEKIQTKESIKILVLSLSFVALAYCTSSVLAINYS